MIYLNKEDKRPLYEQLYEVIKQDIITGQLPKGASLSSLRVMERELKVSRNTVDRAYQQLTTEGYVRSVQGAGYFVEDISSDYFRESGVPQKNPEQQPPAPKEKLRYDFEYSSIDAALFPWSRWNKYVQNAIWAESYGSVLSYENNKGNYQLRKSLCGYLYRHRGVQCRPEQLIISAGTQYAMEILANILPPSVNRIAFEEPGYDAMRRLLESKGYPITPIPVKKTGVDTALLEKTDCNLLYITPSHQFPTGTVTTIATRNKLMKWAQETGSYIIENDYDSEFRYGMIPIPSLQSLDWGQRLIYLGTLSKVMSPSIRCAFLILPDALLQIYEEKYHFFNAALPSYHQMAIAQFIEDGLLEKHLRRLSTVNEKKYGVLIGAIKEFLAGEVEIFQPPAGVHTLVRIPRCVNQNDLIQKMRGASIGIYGINTHFYNKKNAREDIFLMGFNAMPEDAIREGCKKMAQVLRKEYGQVNCPPKN